MDRLIVEDKKITGIVYNPDNLAREYGTNIYITKKGETVRYTFRTSIVFGGIFADAYNIFHLSKHNEYINNKLPDDNAYRLAVACSKALCPLVVLVDKTGQFYGIISSRIIDNWLKNKPFIEKEFIGDYAQRYIHMTEDSLKSNNEISKLLFNNLFYSCFFSVLYPAYTNDVRETEIYFPLVPFQKPIKTKGIQTMELIDDYIMIGQKGNITDLTEFNYQDVLSEYEKLEGMGKLSGEYSIDYDIDINGLIDSISASFDLNNEKGENLTKIKMTSYFLTEFPLNIIEDKETIELGEKIINEEKRINKKSLWQQFNDYLDSPL